MKSMGIDGCSAGWFLVCLDENDGSFFGLLVRIDQLSDHLDWAP